MSDTLETGAADADALDKPAGEGGAGGSGGAQTEPVEDKARRMGWRPQTELEADGKVLKRYKSAEEFVADGEEYAPFIKANNAALEKALKKSADELSALKADMKKLGAFASETAKNAYNNAKRDLEAELEAAATAGDVEGVKAANKAMVELGKDAKADLLPTGADADAGWSEAETKWKADNAWFDGTEPGNRAMTTYAQTVDRELAATQPNLTAVQVMAEITKRVKAEFPEKFVNPNRDRPGAVEGAGGPRKSGGHDYSSLPAEAKAMCDKWVKQGIITREKYVQGYQWDSK